jgi:predicted RNA-binding Zn ribbon-like protein
VLDPQADGLDLVASMVAWRFATEVLPHPPKRLKLCDGPNCSWLFLDTSKAGRRRWCDMADCGNAAKSRRHYARQRRR